ncbi:hypothetical protein ACWEDZ_36860, partial [Streptomyces sp. NPDC005047]
MGRGKLRIYLGAAPGVGKTYAMLAEAHRRVERGTDCVVAFVEHHGRARTEVMLRGLEQVPRRELEYRGGAFTELDLDAVLARRPQVALVDELAHTNVPGVRNASSRSASTRRPWWPTFPRPSSRAARAGPSATAGTRGSRAGSNGTPS